MMTTSMGFIICALLLAGGCKSLAPEIPVYPIKDYFDDGQLRAIYFAYTNSAAIEVKHGVYTSYWEGGQKKKEAHYNRGVLEGREASWYENGLMSAVCSYSVGKKDGEEKRWFGDGQLKELWQYKAGKIDGVCKGWYPNGFKMVEIEYRKGLRHGSAKDWYDTGKPFSTTTYVSDKQEGVKTGFYQSGAKKYESLFHNDQRQGRSFAWDKSGKVIAGGIYRDDLPWTGTFIVKWDSEDKWTKAEFKEGIKISETSQSSPPTANGNVGIRENEIFTKKQERQ